jgi:anti-anti-sigma factor
MVVALEDVRVASPCAGVAVVSIADEHDLATRIEFSALLHALVRQNELVVADFSQALFLDSSILKVLIEAHKLALERGSRLCIQLGEECAVKRTFEIAGVLDVVSWAQSRDEALNGSKLELDGRAWNLPRPVNPPQSSQAPFSVQAGREDKTEPEPEAA